MALPNQDTDHRLARIAGVRLADAWGRPARVGGNTMQQPRRHHSVVMRCPVTAGAGHPDSVVIKAHRSWHGQDAENEQLWNRRYNPDSVLFSQARDRYRQELAGLRFMHVTGMTVAAPKVYAHDDEELLIVMEDLGEHGTVLEPLLGEDGGAAEESVLALTRTMARLHAASVGRQRSFADLGGVPRTPLFDWQVFCNAFRRCWDFAQLHGLAVSRGLDSELRDLRTYLTSGGPLVFSPGDVGPGNQYLVDGEIVLFDFEFAGYRHFALELANLLLPFPVVWTSALLPDDVIEQMRDVYFAEAGQSLPGSRPHQQRRAHLYGIAWWTFASVGADLDAALVHDYQWGLSSCRQRHMHKLALLARMAGEGPELRAMGAIAEWIHVVLAELWPDLDPLPPYPSFRAALA